MSFPMEMNWGLAFREWLNQKLKLN